MPSEFDAYAPDCDHDNCTDTPTDATRNGGLYCRRHYDQHRDN